MLSKLKIKIAINSTEKFNQNNMSNYILKKYSENEYVDFLEENKLKPYSHYLSKSDDNNTFFWNVSTLTKEARENIIVPIIEKMPNEISYGEDKVNLSISSKLLEQITYENLIYKNYSTKDQSNYITIKFNSPTSFKSLGNYKILPDVGLIYKSIIMKYNTFSKDYEINDVDVLSSLIDNTNIIDYYLKSTRFDMNDFRIPSFVGNMKIKLKGNTVNKNLISLLFDFATYSGVGLKTSLGMGGIEIR